MAAHSRYSLLRKIAEGGTAEVFLAHQLGPAGFKRLVVLKRVRPTLWSDESFRRMLIDEAHISMALHHSNIVQVLDIGLAGSHYFLVFELVDGWSFSQVMKRARAAQLELPLNLTLHVMAQVCRALAYAHSRTERGVPMGIVHRDISPQNVLLSEQGEVKLADFGIAKARSRFTTSQIGKVKGKPAYMSPEQAVGAPLDARSDLFSLGTCLYWAVTGELPFGASNERDAIARVVYGRFTPPEKKRADIPNAIARLISRALQHDVKDRFQSADEMLAEIERIQRGKLLPPAGETELKAWLAALAAKDGARPIGWLEEGEQPPTAAESNEIELVDDADVVIVTEDSGAHAAASPEPPRKSMARPWMFTGLAAALLAGAYFLTRGDGAAFSLARPSFEAAWPARVRGVPRMDDAGEVTSGALAPRAKQGTNDALAVAVVALVLGGGSADSGSGSGGSFDASSAVDGAGIGSPKAGSSLGETSGSGSTDGGDASNGYSGGGSADGESTDRGNTDGASHVDGSTDRGILDGETATGRAFDGGTAYGWARERRVEEIAAVAAAVSDRDAAPPGAASPPAKAAEAPRAASRASEPPKAPPKSREIVGAPAKPAADPFPDMVAVIIESDPPGADVSIERKVFGKTPIPLKLRAGIAFEIVFAKAGYRTYKVLYRVTARPGQRVRVALPR
jgi:tRNA A-37 threonylcarbamoyl transferase component Bud32